MLPLGREVGHLCLHQPAIGCRLFPGARTCCFHQGQRSGEGDTLGALADKTQKPSEVSGEKGARLGRESGSRVEGTWLGRAV